ncbi:hypothetical protein CWB41_04950 [Methylovirgula ligni]|nr:hypothetical protein CWB41_04950 [Methylovirgula ligni]
MPQWRGAHNSVEFAAHLEDGTFPPRGSRLGSFMFRFVLRLLGLLLLAGAFAALVIDGTRSIAGGALALTPLAQTLAWLSPQKYAALKPELQHHVPHFVWDPLIVHLLTAPTSLVAGALGALVLLAAQKRRPKIGYSNRE